MYVSAIWLVITCRFVTVCGDGEYIIYTAMALRNKSFGSAQEFIWSNDSALYAIREGTTSVKLFKNFKEIRSFKPEFGAEGNILLTNHWLLFVNVLNKLFHLVSEI